MRNYSKRLAGYLIEHPAVETQVDILGERHGTHLKLHIATQADHDHNPALAELLGLKIGDMMAWHDDYVYLIKPDGTVQSNPAAEEKYGKEN